MEQLAEILQFQSSSSRSREEGERLVAALGTATPTNDEPLNLGDSIDKYFFGRTSQMPSSGETETVNSRLETFFRIFESSDDTACQSFLSSLPRSQLNAFWLIKEWVTEECESGQSPYEFVVDAITRGGSRTSA